MEPPRERVGVSTGTGGLVAVVLPTCVCVFYLAQTSKEMWKSILSWWAAGSSSSMGDRRFRLSSERLSARLLEREVG